jgi:hypothetical protein
LPVYLNPQIIVDLVKYQSQVANNQLL